jgi:hypothetical protein
VEEYIEERNDIIQQKEFTSNGFRSLIPVAELQHLNLKPDQFYEFCWDLLYLNVFKILAGDDQEILPALLNRLPNKNLNVKEIIDIDKLREPLRKFVTKSESELDNLYVGKNISSNVKDIFAQRALEILNCLIQNTKIFKTILSGALFPHKVDNPDNRRYLSFVSFLDDSKEFQDLNPFVEYVNKDLRTLPDEAERIKISKLTASFVYFKVKANMLANVTHHEIQHVRSLILNQCLSDLRHDNLTLAFDTAAESAATALLNPTNLIMKPKYRELYSDDCLKYVKDSEKEKDQFCKSFTYFALCKHFKEHINSPQEIFGEEINRISVDTGKCFLETADITRILGELESKIHQEALSCVKDLKKFNDESLQECLKASKVSGRHPTETEIRAKKEIKDNESKQEAKERQENEKKDAEEAIKLAEGQARIKDTEKVDAEKARKEKLPLGGETSPSSSNAPQLRYFTLDYKPYANISKDDLDPILITAKIAEIDSAIKDLKFKEELKRKYGIILKAYSILYMESRSSLEMVDYFIKAKLGADFLEFSLRKEMDHKDADNIFYLARFLVYLLTYENSGISLYQTDCGKIFSDIHWSNSTKNVESLIFKKIKNDARFFTWIFKDLIKHSDVSQMITISNFDSFLNEKVEGNNKDNPQPTDPNLIEKVEERAQFLFDKMKASLAETEKTAQDITGETFSTPTKEPKPVEQTNKTPFVKDENKIDAEKAKKDAKEKARKDAEEKTRLKAEEKAREEAEENLSKQNDAEQQAKKDAEEKARKEQEMKEQAIKDAKGTEQKAQEETKEDERQGDLKAQEEAKKLKSESEEQARKKTEEESNNSSNDNNT